MLCLLLHTHHQCKLEFAYSKCCLLVRTQKTFHDSTALPEKRMLSHLSVEWSITSFPLCPWLYQSAPSTTATDPHCQSLKQAEIESGYKLWYTPEKPRGPFPTQMHVKSPPVLISLGYDYQRVTSIHLK